MPNNLTKYSLVYDADYCSWKFGINEAVIEDTLLEFDIESFIL